MFNFKRVPNQMVVNADSNEKCYKITNKNPPPAQDSPKNIMNILNDDCIQLVLLKLENVGDFWSATQVCTRFQANAIACFPFKGVEFRYSKGYTSSNVILFDSADSFLNLFGPRITSIHCYYVSFIQHFFGSRHREESLSLISQYSGKTLHELQMSGEGNRFYFRSSFEALEKLKMNNVSLLNFNAPLILPKLKSLESGINWMVYKSLSNVATHRNIWFQRVNGWDIYRISKPPSTITKPIKCKLL